MSAQVVSRSVIKYSGWGQVWCKSLWSSCLVLSFKSARSHPVFMYICRSANYGQFWPYTIYFLGDFHEIFMPVFYRFRWKIPKNKMYITFNRPPNLVMDLCGGYITDWMDCIKTWKCSLVRKLYSTKTKLKHSQQSLVLQRPRLMRQIISGCSLWILTCSYCYYSLLQFVDYHLKKHYKITADQRQVVDLQSHCYGKFSRHLIFLFRGAAFKDNIHAGR
jgi:hypothetical protein